MSEQFNEDAQSGGEYSGSRSSFNEASEDQQSQPLQSSAFPDEDEETITMLDVIEREDKLEEEASAVLGNSDEKNCTYPKGYISRQALYSCATCSDGSADTQAAICLACSLECHDNHELYELYTKRNYRCDCGNSKFKPDFECKLMDKHQKSPVNEKNKYNHNFEGRYCVCHKRYPADENDHSPESNDEMWQCVVCEDWYHSKHLESKEEELPNKFEEMVCHQCAPKLSFLYHYKNLDKLEANPLKAAGTTDPEDCDESAEPASQPDADDDEPGTQATHEHITSRNHQQTASNTDNSSNLQHKTETTCESDTNDSQAENKDPEQQDKSAGILQNSTSSSTECTLEKLKRELEERRGSSSTGNPSRGPIFWSDCNWRKMLCRCQKCIDMYKAEDCEYLLDDQDTVHYYEAQGKAIASASETPLERGMSALNRMNRAAVVEALHGYDELKADLSSYLRKFADSKKVVREEDIHEFFQQLKSKKRARFE